MTIELGQGIIIRCKLNMRVVPVSLNDPGELKLKTHDHFRWRRFGGFIRDIEVDKNSMPLRKILAFSYTTSDIEWADVRQDEYLIGVELDGSIHVVLRDGQPIKIQQPNS